MCMSKTEDVKEKRGVGRPTDYDSKYIDQAIEYLQEFENFTEEKKDYMGEIIPTIEGFARYVGAKSRKTLYNWADDHPEFLLTLDEIKNIQCISLQSGGLSGKLNSTITKLLLSANHGLSEKTEQDLTSKGEKIDGFVLEFIKPKNEAKDTDS